MPLGTYALDTLMGLFEASNLVFYTTAPTDQSAGVQVSGGSYAPKPATIVQDVADPHTARNSGTVVFSNLPACTVVAYGLISGTDLIYYEVLSIPKTFAAGEGTSIAPNTLVVTLN